MPLPRVSALALAAGLLFLAPAMSPAQLNPVPAPTPAPPSPPPAFPHNLPAIDAKIDTLLSQMTLEEKVGQLVQFSKGDATGPDNAKVDQDELTAQGNLSSLLNVVGAAATNEVQRQAVEKSRLKIPVLFGQDVIHGYRTVYPVPLALSCSWDPAIAERCARLAAVEASADGIRWTFSPMVDIARDARWGRITEGNGEDPYLGESLAAAWVRGYQGHDLSDPTSLVACVKHFVAYGAPEGGREYNSVDLSERTLRDVYLPPFKAALDAGVGTFMSGFNALNGIPTSANPHTLTDILRKEWNFQGFVVSDWSSILELIDHGIALDGAQAAAKALLAGVDMDMQGNLYITKLAALVKNGQVPAAVVDEAVRRVLRVKFALGLFDHPYTDEKRAAQVTLTPANLAVAREAAESSFVLLKNDPFQDGAPVLPLAGENQTVALIGGLADSKADMLGAWSLQGQPKDVVTLRQSLSDLLHDKLLYAEGVSPKEDTDAGFADALAAAQKADVILVALGESKDMSGEAAARATLDLPGRQLDLLKKLVALNKPTALILFNGRPLALPWELKNVPAVLEAWFPGVQAGPALANVLTGKVNPSGKLTASFPRSVGQEPLYYNTLNTGRPAPKNEKDHYFSGYIDEAKTPLLPFGHGLSYTTFGYSPTQIMTRDTHAADLNADGRIVVQAVVTNTGLRPGAETVQLYIRWRGTSVARPVRELKGFEKIALSPGESRPVRFTLTKRELAFWNIDLKHVVEPGELTVWVAPSSQAGTPAKTLVAP